MAINSVILIGRLTRDPELKQTLSGKSVMEGDIAINMSQERTEFIRFVAFGATAENVCRFCHKGSNICVSGELHNQEWKTKQGESRSRIVVNAFRVEFLEPKGARAAERNDDYMPESYSATPFTPPSQEKFEEIEADNDLPF